MTRYLASLASLGLLLSAAACASWAEETTESKMPKPVFSDVLQMVCGALERDDFQSVDLDEERWTKLWWGGERPWGGKIEGGVLVVGSRVNKEAGHDPSSHMGIIMARRYALRDVVAVAKMRVPFPLVEERGFAHATMHLCSSRPDTYCEIGFGVVNAQAAEKGGPVRWTGPDLAGKVLGRAGWFTVHIEGFDKWRIDDVLPPFGDEKGVFHEVKIERDETKGTCQGFVRGPEGWLACGPAVRVPFSLTVVELKIWTDRPDAPLEAHFDDFRIYPHPDRHPVRFAVVADGDRSRLSVEVIDEASGDVIGRGSCDEMGITNVPLAGKYTFPISLSARIYRDNELIGSAYQAASGVKGLYPGDVWFIRDPASGRRW